MTMYRLVDGVQIPLTPEEETEMVAEWSANAERISQNQWQEQRRQAYGSYGSQLDMIYHDSVDGTTTWVDHVASVKAQYPKPEET